MLTPSVFAVATARQEPRAAVCVVWKEVYDKWDFFYLGSPEEAEMRVRIDSVLTGLDRSHYQVHQG